MELLGVQTDATYCGIDGGGCSELGREGDEHACKWLCIILCAVESSRGNYLVADYARVTLLRVRSHLIL
jgi:hypothetical protein